MNGKRPSMIIMDDPIGGSPEPASRMEADYNKMKSMVEDLRKQVFQLVQRNDVLEKEIQSSVRLLWAAANSQPDQTLKIPRADLESIDPSCLLESGFDEITQETFFKASRSN